MQRYAAALTPSLAAARPQALHNAGVVHRDVKPLNLVLAEAERRFKLIDLGAAADLRNGTNYAPDESILDPSYCPPEQCAPLPCAKRGGRPVLTH